MQDGFEPVNPDKQPTQKKSRKKKVLIWASVILSTLLCTVGIYAYNLYTTVASSQDTTAGKSSLREEQVDVKKEPFTILFIGADQYNSKKESKEGWRPDVMMLAVVNPEKKNIHMVSIPRDTFFQIHGTKTQTKINASAASIYTSTNKLTPINSVRETAQDFLNRQIPIDYYAKINFSGFIDLVDQVGGIDVEVPYDFKMQTFGGKYLHFKKGNQHVNGEEALVFVRQRKQDPEGDLGRNKRQQQAVRQVLDKMLSFKSLTQFTDITKVIGDNFQYSFQVSDILPLMSIYADIPKENNHIIKLNTYSKTLPAHGDCQITTDGERKRVVAELLKAMDKPYNEADLTYDFEQDLKNPNRKQKPGKSISLKGE
ncbi:LCP family protein [Baia soyae]|uniref:LytR family transcriptional attenuator n=1 Tax=Baia soyae TaxID=1544746 RepID=A0A4R2SES3_9BACL|nr:LCP family protein [Baia soyae]TCP69651.1 LytR family transcriptional attenuator [Baia soyae]